MPWVCVHVDSTEGIDCGRDAITSVSKRYEAPYAFTGNLENVTIDVSGEHMPRRSSDSGYTEHHEARARMVEAAEANGIAVCWSRMELCDDGHYRLVAYVVDKDGNEVIRYPRAHPATIPPEETEVWVAPGEDLGLFRIHGVPMGIVVCSELWAPEPARVLAIRGAEVLLSPAGGGFTTLTNNWQIIARARAIENLCYVALTNNIWEDEVGAAMVTGPEHVVSASGFEELVLANLDLKRLRWLRSNNDSLIDPKQFWSIPGLTRFRRPELYEDLVKPREDVYDFHTEPGKESE